MSFIKRFLLISACSIALVTSLIHLLVHYGTQQIISPRVSTNTPLILLVNTNPSGIGGAEVHSVYATKALHEAGQHVALLVTHNRPTHHMATKEEVPLITCRAGWLWQIKPLYRWLLGKTLRTLAQKQHVAIIQCSTEREAAVALQAVPPQIPVILEQHNQKTLQNPQALRGLAAAIGVSKKVTNYLADANQHYHLGMRQVVNIAPFFNQTRCLNFTPPTQDRTTFFATTFGFNLIPDAPVIACVAHLRSANKNQDLLLKAAAHLIHQDNIPLNIILVGEGPRLKTLRKLAQELKIENHVFATGFISAPQAVVWYSDIHVLPSKIATETYGLVHVEAALMGKPSVGARGTGAEEILLDRKTGMLFVNNNQQSLYEALLWLLKHPGQSKEMGQRAKKRALKHFTNQQKLERLLTLYQKMGCQIISTSR